MLECFQTLQNVCPGKISTETYNTIKTLLSTSGIGVFQGTLTPMETQFAIEELVTSEVRHENPVINDMQCMHTILRLPSELPAYSVIITKFKRRNGAPYLYAVTRTHW